MGLIPSYLHNPPKWVSHGVCRICYPMMFETIKGEETGSSSSNPE